MSYQNETYEPKLKEAQEYQDFITDELLKRGIILNQYSSTKYQYNVGESASGIEVKYDRLLETYGNLFLEVEERSDPSVDGFTASGIFRKDKMWLYLIGNYKKALLLHKHQMQVLLRMPEEVLESKGFTKKTNSTDTAHGFTVKYEILRDSNYCLNSFVFGGDSQ